MRADIARELRKYRAERDESTGDNVPDSGELSAADLLAAVRLAEVDRDFSELLEVETALQRLAAGTYGVCVDCRDAVELRRLEKVPHAARCRACQTAAERSGGRRRPATL
ncbi:MAG TPA: TraR/DksA family transcriptional regulator [Gammaproteobacteria bacterium]|nr:TraR/DksA family transcriptional regulator [Gammaproteobacteria bacterium]